MRLSIVGATGLQDINQIRESNKLSQAHKVFEILKNYRLYSLLSAEEYKTRIKWRRRLPRKAVDVVDNAGSEDSWKIPKFLNEKLIVFASLQYK